VYYTMRGGALILLPAGGEKSAQEADIAKAIVLSIDPEE
jgi:putative component of toxin-antitoxin plasmid stabilization module